MCKKSTKGLIVWEDQKKGWVASEEDPGEMTKKKE